MTRALFCVMAAALVAGCAKRDNQIEVDGQVYRGSAKAERGDLAAFTAVGGPVVASLEVATQAAAYNAVQHCIRYFGTSDILWQDGPERADGTAVIDNDKVVLTGRCVEP